MLSVESYFSTFDVGKVASVDGFVSPGFDSRTMSVLAPGLVLLAPCCRGG